MWKHVRRSWNRCRVYGSRLVNGFSSLGEVQIKTCSLGTCIPELNLARSNHVVVTDLDGNPCR